MSTTLEQDYLALRLALVRCKPLHRPGEAFAAERLAGALYGCQTQLEEFRRRYRRRMPKAMERETRSWLACLERWRSALLRGEVPAELRAA